MRAALLALLLFAPMASAQMPQPKVDDVDGFFDKLSKSASEAKAVDVAPRNGRTLVVEHPASGVLRLVTKGEADKGVKPTLGVEELRAAGPARNGVFMLKLTRTGAGGKPMATADCTGEYWIKGDTRQAATIVCPGTGEDAPPVLHAVLRINPGSTTISMKLPKSKQSYIFMTPELFERG
jgi:hypothetical protein